MFITEIIKLKTPQQGYALGNLTLPSVNDTIMLVVKFTYEENNMTNFRRVMLPLLAVLSLSFTQTLFAQATFDFENIDTILEDNAFNDIANRYASVLLSLFPERGTRLGFSSANTLLDERTPQHSAHALSALQSIRKQLEEIKPSTLSAAKQADLQLLLNDVDYMIWLEKQNRVTNSPLYYAEALDAVYDLRLKQTASPIRQRLDISARLKELSNVATQAETYLKTAAPFQAQLAMEKAYYAFLAMDELTDFLLQTAKDVDTSTQIKNESIAAKRAIKRLFDLFKQLSQAQSARDFRLGEEDYIFLLNTQYQIKQSPEKLLAQLQKNLQQAQENLTKALEPFMLNMEAEEVTVLDIADTEQPAVPTKKAKKASKKSRKKVEEKPLRNAQDFYAVAKRITDVEAQEDPIKTLKADAVNTASFFNESGLLPVKNFDFNVAAMPQYYAYTQAYLFVPPYGNQLAPQVDFFLRLPAGNSLAQQEQLNRDFNAPTRKLMLSTELMPGRYYQTVLMQNLSNQRRFYPAHTMANGWSAYAQQLARETGFLVSDEELLFLAWHEYIRALTALADAKLHTRQFSYTDTLNMLTLEHGLEQTQAETLIKQVVVQPGEALSYQAGLDVLQTLRKKYQKKLGKKFDELKFHTYVLKSGDITPEYLAKEVEAAYKQNAKK